MRHQWRASPFPHASQLTLPGESVAVLDDWGRVPVSEPDVAVVEVSKHWQGGRGSVLNRLVIRATGPGWVAFIERVAIIIRWIFPVAVAIETVDGMTVGTTANIGSVSILNAC